jgi:hypothetical protein
VSGNVLPKPVENKWKISFRWLIQALHIHRCFQNTSPPWTHKACTVNRLQKTCVQVPDKALPDKCPAASRVTKSPKSTCLNLSI